MAAIVILDLNDDCLVPVPNIIWMVTIISITTNTHLTIILLHQFATSFASTIAYSAVQVHSVTNKANMGTFHDQPLSSHDERLVRHQHPAYDLLALTNGHLHPVGKVRRLAI